MTHKRVKCGRLKRCDVCGVTGCPPTRRLLTAAMKHVAGGGPGGPGGGGGGGRGGDGLGWTEASLQAAAADLGYSPAVVGQLPRGKGSLVEHFVEECDSRLSVMISARHDDLADMSSKAGVSHSPFTTQPPRCRDPSVFVCIFRQPPVLKTNHVSVTVFNVKLNASRSRLQKYLSVSRPFIEVMILANERMNGWTVVDDPDARNVSWR